MKALINKDYPAVLVGSLEVFSFAIFKGVNRRVR